MMKIRIDKLIADSGLCTRSDARELIRRGAVLINGVPVTSPETKAERDTDEIYADGKPLFVREFVYLMMDKPSGYVCATEDKSQPTVLDLLPIEYRRMGVFPVGRLDIDTTGLLLLTNDGEFAHQVISPKTNTLKTYLARTERPVTREDAAAFSEGVTLRDGTACRPSGLEPLSGDRCLVTVSEGKYHQVKRMLASRGKRVLTLRRLSIGTLELDGSLAPGGFRELTQMEIFAVKGTLSHKTDP